MCPQRKHSLRLGIKFGYLLGMPLLARLILNHSHPQWICCSNCLLEPHCSTFSTWLDPKGDPSAQLYLVIIIIIIIIIILSDPQVWRWWDIGCSLLRARRGWKTSFVSQRRWYSVGGQVRILHIILILLVTILNPMITSGEYSCQPAVGPVAVVLVHVLNRDTEVQAVLGEGWSDLENIALIWLNLIRRWDRGSGDIAKRGEQQCDLGGDLCQQAVLHHLHHRLHPLLYRVPDMLPKPWWRTNIPFSPVVI